MDIENDVKIFLLDLKKFKKLINQVKTKDGQVNSTSTRSECERLGKYWFNTLKKDLVETHGFSDDNDVIKAKNTAFTHLLHLCSTHGNKKPQYLKDINIILTKFQQEIISPLQTNNTPKHSLIDGSFEQLLKSILNAEQNEYLSEAINCAKSGYLKASVVLGWCACIDHIHKKIDSLGYTTFNVTSAQLASQQKGRFKNFNKTYSISSLSELREVFDKDILTIIEGMNLIDFNQGTRLKSCFDMRNHSGHPGDAPITPYNVMSFFSDINEIILINTKFNIS
ncbi:MAG: hypothetical protein PHW82_15095 [Bacteroidales bacterium]|jgi:hypothetical protein|nr:hypothetical protein [Bacteroidales bacterium]